jgi:hypothetical protein
VTFIKCDKENSHFRWNILFKEKNGSVGSFGIDFWPHLLLRISVL